LELSITTFRGAHKWVHIAAEPELNSLGAVRRTIGVVQDISRQRAEQIRGQQLSSQLMATLESMSDAFYMLDRDWNLVFMNSVAEEMLQVSRDTIIGRNIWDEFPAFRASPAYKGFQRAVAAREEYRAEYHSQVIGQWLSINAFPSDEGLAVYFRIITAEKQLQSQIAESELRLRHITSAALDVVW